jgi:hypothetical protein
MLGMEGKENRRRERDGRIGKSDVYISDRPC